MALETTMHDNGTRLTRTRPWGMFTRCGHRAMCSDGVVRAVTLAPTADTFYSVPAAIRVRGRYVRGFITLDTFDTDDTTVRFHAYTRYADLIPAGPGAVTS